jgi:splicing factor 3B subunit 1
LFANTVAIVSETCGPFTCIPAILNEYRTPELNVRNGCLKALAFVFEYVGEMSKDYIHSVVGLLEDALTDRDHVHRQTACAIVKHLAVGTAGLGYEEALTHLLNLVWPNIFETSPHVIGGVMDAIEAMRLGLGPGVLMSYILQGMFHPARRVREVYWRMYSKSFHSFDEIELMIDTLILGSADAMVPFYPHMDSASDLATGQDYARHHLMMWV